MSDSHLLARLLLSPLLIGAASAAARRWGPATGGWLAALPLTSGPAVLLVALDRGPAFAAAACEGVLFAVVSLAAYALVYAWAARHAGWVVCAALACAAYTACAWVLGRAAASLFTRFALACLAVGGAGRLLPADRGAPATTRAPAWDIPVRMAVAAAVVWGLTRVAAVLGPRTSGLLAPFPVAVTIMATFTHRHAGAAAACRLLRGLLAGLVSFAAFFLAAGALLPTLGTTRAFAWATVAAAITHGASWAIGRTTSPIHLSSERAP